jgi:hypothetical protein
MTTRRESNDLSASEMANSGAKKELEGYSSAFAVRDELKAQEKEAERRRTESREQRRSALRA